MFAALLGALAIAGASLPAASAAATPTPAWTQQTPAQSPGSRSGPAMAFDPAIGKMVLFGGDNNNDTWTYDGQTWTQQTTATSPPKRSVATMVYDPAIGKIVLFGGADSNFSPLADTWTYDGQTWTQQTTAQSPPARFSASMTFDPSTGKVILYGGSNGSSFKNDTWTYDGTNWTQVSTPTNPGARIAPSMAYDPALGKTILFGGYNAGNNTWAFNGTSWTQQAPAQSPPVRYAASLAFDPVTGKVILFGGLDPNSNTPRSDTWSYDGQTWTQATLTASPPGRWYPAMAFDPATGQMVVFGGQTQSNVFGDTWTFGLPSGLPRTWTQQSPATSPPARSGAGMSFDPTTGKLNLFGGYNGTSFLGDTWTYDGTNWTQQTPAQSPPARGPGGMAFDPAIGKTVLFGGISGSTFRNDTWTYNGTTWTQQTTAQSPPGRSAGAMAFDPATGKMVLFGGYDGTSYLGDTWTYDGTNWTQQTTAQSPPARYEASMAFNPATGKMVLFGGYNVSGGLRNDTWTYNGTNWTQQTPPQSPSARAGGSMAFEPATGKLVLFGGSSGSYLNQTWTYNGTTWTQQAPAASPPGRYIGSASFDPAIGKMVLFGGYGGSYLGDTWTYETLTASPTLSTTAASGTIGGSISDSATLASGVSPTGSITFRAYGPGDATCAGAPAFTSSAIPVSGNGSYGSGNFTPSQAGTYNWTATYTGDGSNDPATSACGAANETSTVAKATPALSTTASAGVTIGGQIHDSATIASGYTPTGSITFKLYAPGDTSCTGTPADTSTPVAVSGNGSFDSPNFTPTTAGTYRWVASYSGDANNDPATGACNDTGESVVVAKASPALSTTASAGVTIGGQVHDSATISSGYNPGGTTTFKLYGPNDATCTGTPADTSTPVAVSGNGTYQSPDFTPTAPGTYRWVASYSGDANNNSTAGACNDPGESVAVIALPGSPTITDKPLAVDTATTATFAFTGAPGETFECSLDGGAFSACSSPATFPAPIGSHSFSVRALNSLGAPGPTADYSWQVADIARCKLREIRARLFVYRSKDAVRLVATYKSATSAKVAVKYYEAKADGTAGAKLGQISQTFETAGLFRTRKSFPAARMRRLRSSASGFVASFRVPGTPGFCEQAFTKSLSIKKTIHRQAVWFQAD